MRSIVSSLLVVGLLTANSAWAQPEPVEQLYATLREGGEGSKQAAFKLFRRGDQDERLLEIMANADGTSKRGWRLSILSALDVGALAQGDTTRPSAACRLAFEALDDPDDEVVKLAVQTFAAIGSEDAYGFLSDRLGRLRFASRESTEGAVARRLIDALAGMRNPQRATEALARVLAERLGAALEPRILEALERLTAHQFSSPHEWVAWTESVRGLTLAEWRQEISNRRAARNSHYERECEEMFMSLLAALRDEPDRRLEVLQNGLTRSTIPSVRRRAVVELSRMGRLEREGEQRTRAIAVLRSQLPGKGQASPYYDEIQALVLLHLGKTGDPSLLDELARFLTVTSARMRVAAADALGALGAPGGTLPLVRELRRSGERSVDSEVTQAVIVALGQIGSNEVIPDEKKQVSDVLVSFCRQLLASTDANPLVALPLTRSAEALGKLPYSDAAAAKPVVALLAELLVYSDAKVRFAAATSLGPLAHGEAFGLLQARLDAESEDYIRKAIIDAIGQQGLANPGLAGPAIKLLVPWLFAGDALRPRAADAIKRLTRDETFEGLELLVVALRKDRDAAVALEVAAPFLRALPRPDELTEAMKPHRDRYFRLIATRAWSALGDEPVKALSDFDAVIEGRGWGSISLDSAPIYLGRGRAKLALGLPNEAFAVSRECLEVLLAGEQSSPEQRLEAWTIALDALELAKIKRPTAVDGMLKQLEPFAAQTPASLRERLQALEATK